MRFFRLDASLRREGSVTRALADVVEREWRCVHPDVEVVRRDLGLQPLPAVWPEAARRFVSSHGERSELAATLVDELLAADAYVFAVPLYNFGVPQQVKHWIDLVITDERAADVSRPLLPGRPAVLVEARGGAYGPGMPREGWNHGTPYLGRILRDVWGLDLVVVAAELTAAATNPAMAHLAEMARRSLEDAHAVAGRYAGEVLRRLASRA